MAEPYIPAPLDRIETDMRILDCIATLAGINDDLHQVSGDSLALLLDMVREDVQRATSELRAAERG